ncbi:two-component system response regulator [Spirochaeta lutea]|uniref:two-component system response regulator n=1 Tax=Spirochaeta lutea TaxID=1480694 RepID=UPI000691A4F8|nr:EAL domain-containing protein [Spirochaeta lutea]
MEKLRISIVEDERIIALDLQRHLERLGYQVVGIYSSGEEIISAFQHSQSSLPDIVLMDIMLGTGMNGIECACILKKDHLLPVVFLTAFADSQTLDAAKAAEPYGYILKPFRDRELQSTLEIAAYKHKSTISEKQKHGIIESILNNAQEGIVLIDNQFLVEYVNNTILEMLDMPGEPDHYIGTPVQEQFQLFYPRTLQPIDIQGLVANSLTLPHFIPELVCFDSSKHTRTVSLRLGSIGGVSPKSGIILTLLDLTEIKELTRSVEYQQRHDSLTGLPNRQSFIQILNGILSQDPAPSELSNSKVILVNLDKFRVLNEVCGHIAGDHLLREVAASLEVLGMQYQAYTARIGSDEFALLCSSREQALEQSILQEIAKTFVWDGQEFFITPSIGVVGLDDVNPDPKGILAAADEACSMVKQRGGNAIEYFQANQQRSEKIRGEALWVTRIIRGLQEQRFLLYGQTINPLKPEFPLKQEVLLRLRENQDTIIGPGAFIGAAERYNIMPSIDLWVLTTTLEYLTHKKNPERCIHCVNLSGNSLQDTATATTLLSVLSKFPDLCTSICLEITETCAIQNFDRVIGFMTEARDMGIQFALDDFGNGFSSFGYLKRLPVSVLKIDGSFVRDIDRDSKNLAMVTAINNIGHDLGMRTVAEFVSSRPVLDLLHTIGVDYAQGYHISEPSPLTEP